MRKLIILSLFAAGLLQMQPALAQGPSASPPPIPARAGYLTDLTVKLPASDAQGLEAYLEQTQQDTKAAFYILLMDSTKPTDIVTYSHQVADAWGLKPDSRQDKWVLILVALGDGAINITDSQAVKALMPDSELSQILAQDIKPALDEGNLALGLASGVKAIAQGLVLAVPKDTGASGANDAARYWAELLVLALVGVLAVGLYFLVTRRL